MEFVYMLTHTYNEVPRATFVRCSMPQDTFEQLVAFIEFKASEIHESYGMDQEEIAEVLCQLYGCEVVPNSAYPNVIEINHYLNWEKYCGHSEQIEQIKEFQRDDLQVMLEFYIERHMEASR